MKSFEIDAKDQSMGRMASKIASILRGKTLATYEPSVLPQTEVVVINADKIKFTGTKMETKNYFHYSGWPGGMKTRTLKGEWAKNPQRVIRQAVLRMLPVNKMRAKIIKNLKFK